MYADVFLLAYMYLRRSLAHTTCTWFFFFCQYIWGASPPPPPNTKKLATLLPMVMSLVVSNGHFDSERKSQTHTHIHTYAQTHISTRGIWFLFTTSIWTRTFVFDNFLANCGTFMYQTMDMMCVWLFTCHGHIWCTLSIDQFLTYSYIYARRK